MSIGERILERREKAGLSQAELAKIMDVSRQAVSKWENDITSPDTINLIRLSDVLNCEVEYIATGKIIAPEPPSIIVKLVDNEPKIVTKIVEKPVIRRRIVRQTIRNPIEYGLIFIVSLVLGFILGKLL